MNRLRILAVSLVLVALFTLGALVGQELSR